MLRFNEANISINMEVIKASWKIKCTPERLDMFEF